MNCIWSTLNLNSIYIYIHTWQLKITENLHLIKLMLMLMTILWTWMSTLCQMTAGVWGERNQNILKLSLIFSLSYVMWIIWLSGAVLDPGVHIGWNLPYFRKYFTQIAVNSGLRLKILEAMTSSDERLRRIGTAFISIATSRKARAKQMIFKSNL